MFKGVDHVVIAVKDLDAAIKQYETLYGMPVSERGEPPGAGFKNAYFRFGETFTELISPLGEDSFVQKFLDKRGEGVHHITFIVEDLAASVAEARAAGIRVVDENYDRPEWQEAFISPRSANGTIIQLAQSNRDLAGRMELWPADAYRIEQAGRDDE